MGGVSEQLIATIQQIGQASPDIVRGYRTIADGAAKIGKLDPKVRELISLAVAVTARCDGCIVTHVDAAVRHGATQGRADRGAWGRHLGQCRRGIGVLGAYA